MVYDLLTPHASTVVSEYAFNTTGRVLTDTRNCLSSEAIKMSIYRKDWLEAEMRSQNKSIGEINEDSPKDE